MSQSPALDIPVKFSGVSIGKATARLGCSINRERLNIMSADDFLCNHRLIGRVVLGHADDTNGQAQFWEDVDHSVGGAFDVKGFSVTTKALSVGLTFSLNDIDVEDLSKMAFGEGRLVVSEVQEIPEDEDDFESSRESHPDGSLSTDGPWREFELSRLFDPKKGIYKSLAAAGLTTVGKLSDYTSGDKRLIDLEGIGEGKAQQIEDALLEFWRDNPDAGE